MSVLTTLHAPTHYLHTCPHRLRALHMPTHYIIIIIDHFCIALFSGVPRLTALNSLHTHRLHAHTHYMPTQTTYTQRRHPTHYYMPTDYMPTQTTYTQRLHAHTLHAHTDYIHTKTHAHTLPHADRLHAHTDYIYTKTTCSHRLHTHTLPHADRLHAHTYYMPPHTTCPQTTCPHRLHAHTDTAHPHAKGSVCTRQCRLRVSACLLSQLTRGWCSRSSPHFLPTYLITLSAPLSQRLQRSAS